MEGQTASTVEYADMSSDCQKYPLREYMILRTAELDELQFRPKRELSAAAQCSKAHNT